MQSTDMQSVREACKNSEDPVRIQAVRDALTTGGPRHIYSPTLLGQIRNAFPNLKLGVFTRSPRSYARTVLEWAYPGFPWTAVIAYEDVQRTKPNREGLYKVMADVGIKRLGQVLVVGDTDVDLRAAYHAGVPATVDRSAWPFQFSQEHWRALERVPDAVIRLPQTLLDVLARPNDFLPELERLLSGSTACADGFRFDKIGHFLPKDVVPADYRTAYQIYVCGRYFSHYDSLEQRRKWHALTKSIEDNKDSEVFPPSWVEAIRNFISTQYPAILLPVNLVLAAVPHRPERKARLEAFLQQVGVYMAANPITSFQPTNVTVCADLLAYKPGVKSNHGEHLGAVQRALNVRDHLYVKRPTLANGAKILILDDVVTTGASLMYASKYLKEVGAADVRCLALAKNISDVL